MNQQLAWPVIDTGVYSAERAEDLEDYVATYGGPALVDHLRAATRARWRAQGFARASGAQLRPELFCARQHQRGSNHSIVFPRNLLDPLVIDEPRGRQTLHRAVNHYHADLWSRWRTHATPVAGVPLRTASEGIIQLEFAVKRLGFKAITVASSALAKDPLEDHYPFWERVVELQVPVIVFHDGGTWAGTVPSERRFPGLRLCVLAAGKVHRVRAPALSLSGAPLWVPAGNLPSDALYSSGDRDDAAPLTEAWRRVEEGTLTEAAFRAYVFDTPHRFFTEANPEFFKGTHLEERLRERPPAVAA